MKLLNLITDLVWGTCRLESFNRANGHAYASVAIKPGIFARLLGDKPVVRRYFAKGDGTRFFEWFHANGREIGILASPSDHVLAQWAREHDRRVELFGEDLA